MNPIDFIPHKKPILFIDKVLELKDSEILCLTDIKKHDFFINDGELRLTALPELIAQSAGIMNGVKESKNVSTPPVTMLTAIKKFEIFSIPNINDPLKTLVKVDGELGAHQIVKGEIFQDTQKIATGYLFLYWEDSGTFA